MKESDDFSDKKNDLPQAIIMGILCVVFTVIVCVNNGDAACIFISILIGTALANKVDDYNHILSAVLFILILLIIGFPHFSWICLILCTVAAFFDEKGNDLMDKKEEEIGKLSLMDKLIKHRYLLKITVFVLSLLTLIKIIFPNTFLDGILFFQPITIIYLCLFDFGYDFSDELTDGFNNILQSILR